MSIDVSTAPAAGAKAVVPHKHAHARGEKDDAGVFTNLLSPKAQDAAAAAPDGEAPAKHSARGPTKWQAREHAHWRVFDTMRNGHRGETADRPAAKEEEQVPVDAGGQARPAAIPLVDPVKAVPAPAGSGHAKAGAADATEAVARRVGAEAAAVLAAPVPDAKRPAGEGSPAPAQASMPADAVSVTPKPGRERAAREPEQHVAAAAARPVSTGPVPAGREEAADTPAPKPAEAVAGRPEGGERAAREPAGDRGAPKVAVMSVQTAPAPAAPAVPGLSPTSASFVQSLGSAEALPRYASETAMQGARSAPGPVTTLRIQLHPVDLGTVTATLSGDGDKLSIEVHVENREAHHRLQSDGDAIVKALRGMGFDIDRITVQQAPQAGASPGGATNRENAFAAPDQRAGEGRGQPGRQESGRGYDQRANQGGGGDRGEARSGGVYI